jgi:hypothetical protein
VVTTTPAGPKDLADGGVMTCEYEYEETVTFPIMDSDTIRVGAESEAATHGSSDRPEDSPRPHWGTPQEGSPMQGITVPCRIW